MYSSSEIVDRARGALLGTVVAEGLSARAEHSNPNDLHVGPNTAVMIALADALADRGNIHDDDLEKLLQRRHELEGSCAAAYVPPIAVRFMHDYVLLFANARRLARVAAARPLETDAILVQIAAIGALLLNDDPMQASCASAETRELRRRLPALATGEPSLDEPIGDPAADSVAAAVVATASSGTFEQAIGTALTGHTDAAMAGALAGARFGASGIPTHLVDALENETHERVLALADKLQRQANASSSRMYRIPRTQRSL
jgi:hypothetical protein